MRFLWQAELDLLSIWENTSVTKEWGSNSVTKERIPLSRTGVRFAVFQMEAASPAWLGRNLFLWSGFGFAGL